MKDPVILHIALPTPLRRAFDYLAPPNHDFDTLKVGTRIRVPFGKRELIGIIINISNKSTLSPGQLKQALQIIDDTPLFGEDMLSLYKFASHYYQHAIGEVIFSGLPPLLRSDAKLEIPEESIFALTELGANAPEESLKHASQQLKLVQLLKLHPNGLSRDEIQQADCQAKTLTALLAKGFLRKHARQAAVLSSKKIISHFELNQHQEQAINSITSQSGFVTHLLEGVTGSGKTEVYLHCIDSILSQGKQALVLVPEIGLTPQTVARFQTRFAVPISILHSGLNDKERAYAWLAAHQGKAKIIIGTRSAILAPLPNLGIIILDEEHDASFKQQSGFRYSAKDLAVMRGKLANIPVVLGSATPSLESLHNVEQKRFNRVVLSHRAGQAILPGFHVVDVRQHRLEEGIASQVLTAMQTHLKENNQVLIFINRRGFAPTFLCHQCGWTADCNHCDARLTYHTHSEQLICHHCSRVHPLYKQCRQCHSKEILLMGVGTQRLEKFLQYQFPNIPITRVDRDTTRRKGSMAKLLATVQDDAQILIGTQMLAKGHHFPNVTMVAIIDVDSSLYSSDFRALERMGQIIVQVAGRAGRADKPGTVYLQTHNPDHPMLNNLIQFGYNNFAQQLLQERKSAHLPPFSYLVLFKAESNNIDSSMQFLTDVKSLFKGKDSSLQLFGPLPALMEKKAGKFRAQLLVQAIERRHFHHLLEPVVLQIEALPSCRKVRWSIDVDPQEIF